MPARDNGLGAAAYVPLTELDPRVADAMLELLRDSGIAAYVVPVGGELSSHFGSHLPERPTDRLFVDAAAAEHARQVVSTHLPSMDAEREGPGGEPGPDPRDDDEAWQQIIASYNAEPPDPVPPWPVREDIERGGEPQALSGPGEDHGDDLAIANDDTDEHFVPPPPPPVPRPDTLSAVAWSCLFGGPGYLLLATLVGWPITGWVAFVAVAAFIGGFVTLVVRMGDKPPPDSGPDDGAVV